MQQDVMQVFRKLKDCAETITDFNVFVKNFPHVFTLSSNVDEGGYAFEFDPEKNTIIIKHKNQYGCSMYLFFSEKHQLKIRDDGFAISFNFYQDDLNEVEITFYRDLLDVFQEGLKNV